LVWFREPWHPLGVSILLVSRHREACLDSVSRRTVQLVEGFVVLLPSSGRHGFGKQPVGILYDCRQVRIVFSPGRRSRSLCVEGVGRVEYHKQPGCLWDLGVVSQVGVIGCRVQQEPQVVLYVVSCRPNLCECRGVCQMVVTKIRRVARSRHWGARSGLLLSVLTQSVGRSTETTVDTAASKIASRLLGGYSSKSCRTGSQGPGSVVQGYGRCGGVVLGR
jgi:hypothetical protein